MNNGNYQLVINNTVDLPKSNEGNCPSCKVPLGHKHGYVDPVGTGIYSNCRTCGDLFDFVEDNPERPAQKLEAV